MTPARLHRFLDRWAETAGGTAELINLSENHSFRIEQPDGRRFILRVHRPVYQSAAAIDSELAWLAALRRDTAVPVPKPLPGRDGLLVQAAAADGAPRLAVLFAHEAGCEPQPEDDLDGLFEVLGGYAATLHRHAIGFSPPPQFTRPHWTAGAVLDPHGLWGDWRVSPGVSGAVAAALAALDRQLRADLAAYGSGIARFGLIHADMRLANVLVDGPKVTLIDFDDCGFGWFMYDFAAAISFHEADVRTPEWRRRWLAGYTAIRPLSPEDIASIGTMILLRRMALLAWIGSHGETELAAAHADDFAAVTAQLAEAYLSR